MHRNPGLTGALGGAVGLTAGLIAPPLMRAAGSGLYNLAQWGFGLQPKQTKAENAGLASLPAYDPNWTPEQLQDAIKQWARAAEYHEAIRSAKETIYGRNFSNQGNPVFMVGPGGKIGPYGIMPTYQGTNVTIPNSMAIQ